VHEHMVTAAAASCTAADRLACNGCRDTTNTVSLGVCLMMLLFGLHSIRPAHNGDTPQHYRKQG